MAGLARPARIVDFESGMIDLSLHGPPTFYAHQTSAQLRPDAGSARVVVATGSSSRDRELALSLAVRGYAGSAASAAEVASGVAGEGAAVVVAGCRLATYGVGELVRRLSRRPAPPAVLLLAEPTERGAVVAGLEAGAAGYLLEPAPSIEIELLVERLAREHALARRAELLRATCERLEAELDRRDRTLADRLALALEYRHDETGAHMQRIGLYTEAIARRIGWSGAPLDELRIAASLHDIGKIGLPDRVLLKPASLTPSEFEVIKQHPRIGADILGRSSTPLLALGRDIALAHHERWNGGGYPERLSGESIPLAARMVAVADVYDALVHRRVYRRALPEEAAVAFVERGRGIAFDPRVVDGFLAVLPELRRIRRSLVEPPPVVPATPGYASPGVDPAILTGAAAATARDRSA